LKHSLFLCCNIGLFASANSVPCLLSKLFNQRSLFLDALFKRIVGRPHLGAVIPEGFWLSGLQVLHLRKLCINVGTLRAPVHEALLVAENWLQVLVLVHVVNLKTSSQEVGLNLFQVFSLTQPHFDSAHSSAHVLDRITFNNSFNYMLGLGDLSKVRGLGILRKA
jgi:hypothetical protein